MKRLIGLNGKTLWQPENEPVFAPIREGEDLVQIFEAEDNIDNTYVEGFAGIYPVQTD